MPSEQTPPFSGWPDDARQLVEAAIEAHGGADRWRDARVIRVQRGATRGLLFTLKGLGVTFPLAERFEIRPHDDTVIFLNFPSPGGRGMYRRGDVSIEGPEAISSPGHRATFRGLAKLRRWRPLDALYFFGYALAHYYSLPFSLPAAEFIRSVEGVDGDGARRPGVELRIPKDVETHGRRQRFFFGDGGQIVRHDYTAEVLSRVAVGCHFWEAPIRIDGLLFATRRRVKPCLLGRPAPGTVLDVELSDHAIG